METEYLYSWQLREILSFLANFPYHEEVIMLKYNYFRNRKKYDWTELQQYLLREYPQENARCEWKEFKNLKNSFCGDEKKDVISYVSAIANMEGGHLVIGVKDNTYLKNVLPTNKTEEQQLRMLGDLLKNMSKECLIKAEGRTWYTMPQS